MVFLSSVLFAQAPAAAGAAKGRILLVLPFDNLSPDPQLSYLADGLSENILDTLLRGWLAQRSHDYPDQTTAQVAWMGADGTRGGRSQRQACPTRSFKYAPPPARP